MNDHPESFPDPEDEPDPVPFEEVVKGLEGLGADIERRSMLFVGPRECSQPADDFPSAFRAVSSFVE